MQTFYMNVPVAKGTKKIDKIEVFANLLGFGKDESIKRADLVERCVGAGIISKDVIDKDRAMRIILEKARREYVILNDGRGGGYYRPTPRELIALAKSNKRESNRAVNVFASNKKAKALEEDYRHERIERE